MKNWLANIQNAGIQTRLLVLTVVPVLVTTLILGFYMTTSRIQDIKTSLDDRGKAVARHMAVALEFSLFSGNTKMMQSIAVSAFEDNEIEIITISNDKNQVLVKMENPLARGKDRTGVDATKIMNYREAIVETPIDIDDFADEPAEKNAAATKKILGWVDVSLSTATSDARQTTVFTNSLLIIVSGFLISAIFAIRMGSNVARPIVQLHRAVQRIAQGDYFARVEGISGGELQALANGFNTMATTIQQSQHSLQKEIQQATQDLRQTVSTLEQKNRELDDARREALVASQSKSDFLAKMSHEIRTPVNAVVGFARLVQKKADTPELIEYTQTINQAARQLLYIIDDILNLSKLDAGGAVLEQIPFDLRENVEDVVIMLSQAALEKGLELVLSIHSDVPAHVCGDPTRLSQILTNYVNNAIKFTAQGSVSLQVSLVREDSVTAYVKFAVADTGDGLSAEQITKLFSPFSQVDSSITRKYGGTGLGLAIVKRLTELMHGECGVESEEGKGSTFWVSLPLQKQDKNDDVVIDGTGLVDKSVLIVESNAIARRALRNICIQWGMRVIQANNAKQLADIFKTEKFDYVIVGLNKTEYRSAYRDQVLGEIRHYYTGPIYLLASIPHEDVAFEKDKNIYRQTKPIKRLTLYRLMTGTDVHRQPETLEKSASESLKGMKVLVAEDNEFNRMIIQKLLHEFGVDVIEAKNGVEAVEKFVLHDFDLVLMDIHMPEMDGLEATRQIRSLHVSDQRVSIVALTADVFINESERLADLGIDGVLYKPISEDGLYNELLRWHRARQSTLAAPTTTAASKEPPRAATCSIEMSGDFFLKLKSEIEKNIRLLESIINSSDLSNLRETVHQFNGMVGYFGLSDLLQHGRALERRLTSGENTPEIVVNIRALIEKMRDYLQTNNSP